MHRVVEVRPQDNYVLRVRYADGVSGAVSLKHLVGKGVFALWNDPAAFAQVHIGSVGQIAWSDEIEICSDAIYMQITHQTPEQVFPNLEAEAVGA